jgi:hypothetical protein
MTFGKKIMGIDCIKGTYANKIAGVEFDPIDLGQPGGGTGINSSIGNEWLPRAYKHGAEYVHLAMRFHDNEIQQIAPRHRCMPRALSETHLPASGAGGSDVSQYLSQRFLRQTFLFDAWNQIGGQNFAQSDLQPKSIRMTDIGYWEKVWDTGNYLPCNFSVSVNTSEPKPIIGTTVTLSINCNGPECNTASYRWNGEGANNRTGNSISFAAPLVPGNYSYLVTSARSGCGPKSSVATLSVTRALPVKLISFTAVKEQNHAQLEWATSEEVNSEKFEVERSSNGRKWSTMGTVAASGETVQTTTRYHFRDIEPIQGQNLYRLKMIDRDKTFAYSTIVSLNFESNTGITTYPNPATDKVIIAANEWEKVKQVRIYNNSGLVVYSSEKPEPEINIRAFAAGAYIIGLMRADGVQENVKFVKEAGK